VGGCKCASTGFTSLELNSLKAIRRSLRGSHGTTAEGREIAKELVNATQQGRGLSAPRPRPRAVPPPASPAPTLATISAHSYAWGYSFTLPAAAMSALGDSSSIAGTFSGLLGTIPPDLGPVAQVVAAHLESGLACVQAADKGAGVSLAATWAAPDALVPVPTDYNTILGFEGTFDQPALSVAGASTEPGTQLVTWPVKSSGNGDQMWSYANNYIYGQASGLVVEIANSDPNDDATIQINTYTGGLNQQWLICGDGYIRSRMNGNVLDISGGSTSPGTPVISYHPKYDLMNSFNQYWWGGSLGGPDLDCNSLVTVVQNTTQREMGVDGGCPPGVGDLIYGPGWQSLPPGSIALYVSQYSDGNEMEFLIWDNTLQDYVASFESHQHWCDLAPAECWADSFGWGSGCSLDSQPSDWHTGSRGEWEAPGTVVCRVDWSD
jgi:hypothetical protein